MAIPSLYVLDAVVLLGHLPEGLRQQLPITDEQAELAAPGLEGRAVNADQVADVQGSQQLEGFAPQHVALGVQLDLAAAVDQVEEGRASLAATGGQAARQAIRRVGFLACLEVVVGSVNLLDRRDPVELVRERVDPLLTQALELRPAGVHGGAGQTSLE